MVSPSVVVIRSPGEGKCRGYSTTDRGVNLNMIDRKILLFPMDVIDDIMDGVDDMFGMDGYNRWFAYDVTRNHLRYYRRYRRYNVQLLDNRKGPRWALYPDVMKMIDGLVDDGRIRERIFDGYRDDSMWIDNDVLGLVGYFEKSKRDRKLGYLDARIGYLGDEPVRFRSGRYPLLVHLHLLMTGDSYDITLTGPLIRYFSIDFTGVQPKVRLKVRDLTLDYLQIRVTGRMGIRRRGGYTVSLRPLLNNLIKYVDIVDETMGMIEPLGSLVGRIGSFLGRLEHLGYDGSYGQPMNPYYEPNTILEIDEIERLHRLTSLSILMAEAEIYILESISNRLTYLELGFVEGDYWDDPSPITRLRNIKILHVSTRPSQTNDVNIERWNIPDDISLISTRHVKGLDPERFRDLRYLMMSYGESIDPPPGVVVSISGPYSSSAIVEEYDYMPVWTGESLDVSRSVSLIDQIYDYAPYNSIAFLNIHILESIAECVGDRPVKGEERLS